MHLLNFRDPGFKLKSSSWWDTKKFDFDIALRDLGDNIPGHILHNFFLWNWYKQGLVRIFAQTFIVRSASLYDAKLLLQVIQRIIQILSCM